MSVICPFSVFYLVQAMPAASLYAFASTSADRPLYFFYCVISERQRLSAFRHYLADVLLSFSDIFSRFLSE